MAIYLYVRTSEFEGTEVAIEQRNTLNDILEREHQAMLRYCAARQWTPAECLTDHGAAWNADFASRECGGAVLARLQRGDVLVVFALERLFSSCYDACSTLERLKSDGVGLHVVDLAGDATGAGLQLDLISAAHLFSGLERRRSVERIKNVKKAQRGKGRYLGGSRPFGYMIHSNGRLIENPMEQKVLKKILNLREQGLSLRGIAVEVSTPVAPVSFKTVQRILQRNV